MKFFIPAIVLVAACGLFSCGSKPAGNPGRAGISAASLAAMPTTTMRLQKGAGSPDAVVREALAALAAGDTARLLGMLVTESEFKKYLYPELGAYYPAAADTSEQARQFVWENHALGTFKALRKGMRKLAGRRMELVSVLFTDGAKRCNSYTIHEGTDVKVRLENGEEMNLQEFGAIVEMDGVYKLLSYRDRS